MKYKTLVLSNLRNQVRLKQIKIKEIEIFLNKHVSKENDRKNK